MWGLRPAQFVVIRCRGWPQMLKRNRGIRLFILPPSLPLKAPFFLHFCTKQSLIFFSILTGQNLNEYLCSSHYKTDRQALMSMGNKKKKHIHSLHSETTGDKGRVFTLCNDCDAPEVGFSGIYEVDQMRKEKKIWKICEFNFQTGTCEMENEFFQTKQRVWDINRDKTNSRNHLCISARLTPPPVSHSPGGREERLYSSGLIRDGDVIKSCQIKDSLSCDLTFTN